MAVPSKPRKRLVLCFDGTGNAYQGTTGDTNIVKIHDMLDRNHAHQMHYYQPGIGTYPTDGGVNVSWFKSIQRKFEATIDEAIATSFDSHVIAGYRFIMRYYSPGDLIYIFGFSRGAFTARFLARMVANVGLLSMGNEEMVPFAYKVYQDYETSFDAKKDGSELYMRLFKRSFCRDGRDLSQDGSTIQNRETSDENEIKVHFLGLFDCVNSVGTLDLPFFKTIPLPQVKGTARHVRHAVAVDERRVKFKPALLNQEINDAHDEDIKEVWFPGNHGDVGGGWTAELDKNADRSKMDSAQVAAYNDQTSKLHWDRGNDPFQLSDIALKWMIDEVDNLDEEQSIAWDPVLKEGFMTRFEQHRKPMINAKMHDTMAFGGGSSWTKVLLWNFMEWIPFFKRWEYFREKGWDYIALPPNMGNRRDIPPGAMFHHSLLERMRYFGGKDKKNPYNPFNDVWLHQQQAKALKLSHANVTKIMTGQPLEIKGLHFTHEDDKDSLVAISDKVTKKADRIYSLRHAP